MHLGLSENARPQDHGIESLNRRLRSESFKFQPFEALDVRGALDWTDHIDLSLKPTFWTISPPKRNFTALPAALTPEAQWYSDDPVRLCCDARRRYDPQHYDRHRWVAAALSACRCNGRTAEFVGVDSEQSFPYHRPISVCPCIDEPYLRTYTEMLPSCHDGHSKSKYYRYLLPNVRRRALS